MLKTIAPSSPLLKKHIECIYFYTGEVDSNFKYLAFPHYNTGLSFFKGATILRNESSLEIIACNESDVKLEILGKYTCPVMVDYKGKMKEISINFKPLGFNHFFRTPYQFLAPQFSQELINDIWKRFGDNLKFNEYDLSQLESFLLAQHEENTALEPIENSLSILGDVNDDTPITELAIKLGYNLKTFQRHFKKYMGCSPIEYRRICRFRNSIDAKLNGSQLKNLTDLTYEGGYFDQSYFIKEFKKLTNHNPKDFFKKAGKIDGDKLIWEIR